MLNVTNNLDRTAEAEISNWPFSYGSTLDTGNGIITADSFLAVNVNVDETVTLPCRFKGVSYDGYLVICDATGAEVCRGQLFEKTSTDSEWCSLFLYNRTGVLMGSITCKNNIPQMLFSLSRDTTDMHYFGAKAFVLLPQCHIQSLQGQARSFGASGAYTTANMTMRCTTGEITGSTVTGHNIVPAATDAGYAFSVFNIQQAEPNKWCRISINGELYNVEDCNLIIKSSLTSNLRVIYTSDAIVLRGVLDV